MRYLKHHAHATEAILAKARGFANWARSIAIFSSSRERQEFKRHAAALRGLLGGADFQHGDLHRILRAAADASRAGLQADRASVWLRDRSGRVLEMQALSERRPMLAVDVATMPADDSDELLKLLSKGDVLAASDAQRAPYLKWLFERHPGLRRTTSRIDVPIILDGMLAGLIIISMSHRYVSWTEQQVQFAREIGTFVALAAERHERLRFENQLIAVNTRLVAEIDRREANERATRQRQAVLADLVKTSGDEAQPPEHVMQLMVEALRDQFEIERVAIWLVDHDLDVMRAAATVDLAAGSGDCSHYTPNVSHYRAAALAGEPLFADAVDGAPYLAATLKAAPMASRVTVRMDIPIMRNGEFGGVIICSTGPKSRQWSNEDALFASAMASVACFLIERRQRQTVEQDLRRANTEVEAANKAKSLFLANMSHEIRTPMNGVFGMTDLLLRTALTERQTRLVTTINQSALTLLTIINDILDLSRIEAGKLEMDNYDFDLVKTVEGAAELFAEAAVKKDLNFSLFIAPDVPAAVIGDAGRFRQVCVNLIGNAVKFTQTGSVAVRLTASEAAGPKPKLLLEVRDTGIGIGADALSRLCQPFSQADTSISRRFGGTGLGLSISMHLASLMGGRILLASQAGEGTTVRFEVSLSPAVTPLARVAETALVGARMLVVDDCDTNRDILASYLSAEGVDCVVAACADEAEVAVARARAEGRPIEVVFADMVMPGSDGLALIQHLRADVRNSGMGYVLVTSLSWKGDQRSARAGGVSSLLTKPVRVADVTLAARRALAAARGNEASDTALLDVPALQASSTDQLFTGHVLLAEDNPVNVEVACEYLSSLGLTYDVASDGADACARAAARRYDAILMDCQMPNVDGLEATRRLRVLEAERGLPRTPIIAVTANAYEADRQACFEAGMDDYIAKPFAEVQLVACLTSWLRPAAAASTVDEAHPEPLNAALVAAMLDERPQLFSKISKAYLTHSPRLINELIEAAATGSVAALEAAAHSLKSSSANVGAERLAHLCGELETSARSRDVTNVTGAVQRIAIEFRSVGQALEHQAKRRQAS